LCFCFVFLRLVYLMLPVSLGCVVFLFCFSSSCVPYVASFSRLCCVFLRLVYLMLPVSLGCAVFLFCFSSSCVHYVASFPILSILIAHSIFSNVYFQALLKLKQRKTCICRLPIKLKGYQKGNQKSYIVNRHTIF
jgi:hypothetical protein